MHLVALCNEQASRKGHIVTWQPRAAVAKGRDHVLGHAPHDPTPASTLSHLALLLQCVLMCRGVLELMPGSA